MTIKQFIEKAIEGGYTHKVLKSFGVEEVFNDEIWLPCILLDPLAWQAVGKVEEWIVNPKDFINSELTGKPVKSMWYQNMHRMIDALAEGKTIEQFLETL